VEKLWDNSLSTLINSNPQAFLDFILSDATCLYHHRTKLKGTQRQPDAVLEVERHGQIFIVNPEFQSYWDRKMAERLLLYHVLLYCEHKLPVRSYTIALLKRAKMAPSPLLWTQPGEPPGQAVERLRFSYEVIEMWEKHPEDLLRLKHVELLPLLPLTKGGATREIVELMFDGLAGEPYREFALIGFTFASIMFRKLKRYSDLKWLERRFRHMHDIIRESPVYEWILAEGKAEGEAKGKAEGEAKGKAETRQAVVGLVQERFPGLAQLAEEVVATIDNFAQLVRLTANIGSAQSVEQARQVLSDARQ
jgi:predicted transposase YdaD